MVNTRKKNIKINKNIDQSTSWVSSRYHIQIVVVEIIFIIVIIVIIVILHRMLKMLKQWDDNHGKSVFSRWKHFFLWSFVLKILQTIYDSNIFCFPWFIIHFIVIIQAKIKFFLVFFKYLIQFLHFLFNFSFFDFISIILYFVLFCFCLFVAWMNWKKRKETWIDCWIKNQWNEIGEKKKSRVKKINKIFRILGWWR